MHIVVISHNQNEFVFPMLSALRPSEPLFVFDRCTPVKLPNRIVNSSGEGFLAGRMRDLGANGLDDDILFLDGDKIPQGDIVADIEKLKDKYDCICYGIAPENEHSEFRGFMKNIDADGLVCFQERKTNLAYGCYSCGMWICKDAIRKIRDLNGGRIFHPDFDGRWGDEDNFLADELNYLGFRIGYSTHVRLSGDFSDCRDKMDIYVENFAKRMMLRKNLLGL